MERFEVETVTHHADLIYFTWNDVGGIYNVYRDGQHLYEGTVPEFRDGDFKHAKMYNYAIERVENGEVVDVIALQTTAFAEQLNQENPLQFLVLTTIVSKTQIALAWEAIEGINTYAIYRNDVWMQTVATNQYSDRDFLLDETYTYTICSQRPLSQSEEALSRSKSIVAQVFGTLNPVSSKKEAAVEVFKMTKFIAKPRRLLTPITEKVSRKHVNRWHFRYATFLQEEWITNPNLFARDHFFKGDGRGFHPEGEGYRTRVDIELAYDRDRIPMTVTKDIGQTISYNYAKKFRRKGVASHDGIIFERMDHGEEEAGFLLTHAVGNPLVTAPDIDYEVLGVMRRNGTFDITGYHDQAPHHEIYLMRGEGADWLPVHQATSKGLAWMSRITAWHYWRFSNFE